MSAASSTAGYGVAASNSKINNNKNNMEVAQNNNYSYGIFKNIKKCRTCLSTNRDTVTLDTIVPDGVERSTYLESLRQCTGHQVPVTNSCGSYLYPMQICLRCCKALEVAIHFVRMAKDSEMKLEMEAAKAKLQTTRNGTKVMPPQTHEVELKRKAGESGVNLFSSQFSKFVQSYGPIIEENVLYMRGTKMPRVEAPTEDVENPTGKDIILYDIIYDTTENEDDENDVSDTKNNETFFESTTNGDNCNGDGAIIHEDNSKIYINGDDDDHNNNINNNINNNNNNYNNNNNRTKNDGNNILKTNCSDNNSQMLKTTNEDSSATTTTTVTATAETTTTTTKSSNILEKAFYLACQDDNPDLYVENVKCFDEIKIDLLNSLENCTSPSPPETPVPNQSYSVSEILPDKRNINPPYETALFACDLCIFQTTFPSVLRTHYQREHNRELPEALIQNDSSSSNNNNIPTISSSSSSSETTSPLHDLNSVVYSFKCRSCNNFTAKTKSEICLHLTEHHKIEHNTDLFYIEQQHCPSCKRIFKDIKSLRTHYTRVHVLNNVKTDINETYICDNCDKSYNKKSSLLSHQRYCKSKDPVSCSFCIKQFNTVRNYELHLEQEHAVNTVHECEVCSKTFKNADALAMHRKRHTERHFQCNECSLNYVNAAELKVHYERMHVRHEHVNCQACGQQFQNRSLLREHEQRSHQQKIYRCESCDFETNMRTRLRQHQYEHTGYPYKCTVCHEEFAERTKIRLHSKKMHGIELFDEQLAEMFRERLGYTSRQDAFSKANNSLEIPGFSDECFDLKDLGLDYNDLTTDLFSMNNNNMLDNLLDVIP